MVMPFAGLARVSPWRALIPMALASAIYYGALTYLVSRLGTDLDVVIRAVGRVNSVLAIAAGAVVLVIVIWIVLRRRR
jgi:membrane protein DedA with SNARE-associated domain